MLYYYPYLGGDLSMKKRFLSIIFALLLTVPFLFPNQSVQANASDGTVIVYLDPGHGGSESGTTPYGIPEKTVNLQISKKIERKLKNLGYTVIMSRTDDSAVSLQDRAAEANQLNADILVSVHNNAMPGNNNVSGIETYYYSSSSSYPPLPENKHTHMDPPRIADSKRLAKSIHNNLIRSTGAFDRGVRTAAFVVTREAHMPSVLLELGFMTNLTEHAKLLTNSYQETLSSSVVHGINQYFGIQEGLTSFEFVDKAKALPTVSAINNMNASNFSRAKNDIQATRRLYNALSPLAKRNRNALRWESYLVDKEMAVGAVFIQQTKTLPSVSMIEKMSQTSLTQLSAQLQTIRNGYNRLSILAQQDKDVSEWAYYLSLKEATLESVLVDEAKDFVKDARNLPSVSQIEAMNSNQFNQAKAAVQQSRDAYNKLSSLSKQNSDVIRWESYLIDKERAIGTVFVEEAKSLPSVSAIEQLSSAELVNIDTTLASVRALYNNLSQVAQQDSDVIRWEGDLRDKEDATGLTFVEQGRNLPTVGIIRQMNVSQLKELQTVLETVRISFEKLAPVVKQSQDVSRWEGYLTIKEDVVASIQETNELMTTFVNSARELPSVSSIESMTNEQLVLLTTELENTRIMYNNLSSEAKANQTVSRWENYLVQKEAAVNVN